MSSPLNADQQSAYDIINAQLAQWGVGQLSGDLSNLIKQGLDANAIVIELQNTNAYKQRFSGNQQRQAKGLSALSPAEYIAAEDSYKQVLRQYGMPSGFYDSNDDLTKFIVNDVSASELNDRAQAAQSIWLNADPVVKQTWTSFYGLKDGDAIASILDPTVAVPIVQRQAKAAQFGALATENGLNADKSRLEQYADLGISQDAMGNAFSKIGQNIGTDQAIGNRFGSQVSQADEEAATVTGTGSAINKLTQLRQSETALFRQRAAAESGALSRTSGGKF